MTIDKIPEDCDTKGALEAIIDNWEQIEKDAENKALDTITKRKDNALFFMYYKQCYLEHTVRKYIRKAMGNSKKHTDYLYRLMDGKE